MWSPYSSMSDLPNPIFSAISQIGCRFAAWAMSRSVGTELLLIVKLLWSSILHFSHELLQTERRTQVHDCSPGLKVIEQSPRRYRNLADSVVKRHLICLRRLSISAHLPHKLQGRILQLLLRRRPLRLAQLPDVSTHSSPSMRPPACVRKRLPTEFCPALQETACVLFD